MIDAPEILGEQTFVEKDDGIQMELVCIVHGSPVPEIVWFRDGTRVIPDHRIRAGRIGRKHLLTVDRITAEADAGTYVCNASNDKGQSMQSFRVLGEKICSILSDYISLIRNPTYRGRDWTKCIPWQCCFVVCTVHNKKALHQEKDAL